MMVGMGVGPAGEPVGPPPAEPRGPAAGTATARRRLSCRHRRQGHRAVRPSSSCGGRPPSGGPDPGSLVWAQGMAGWQPAGEVAELAPLFAAVPPPIPGAA